MGRPHKGKKAPLRKVYSKMHRGFLREYCLFDIAMDVPFLELPGQQPADSEERARFWLNLKQQVEPNNPEYMSSS